MKSTLSFVLILFSLLSIGQVPVDADDQFVKGGYRGKSQIDPTQYVDLTTGKAQINIPIANLSGSGISMPVSLFYDGGGRKVDEYASSVGLGWDLSIPYSIQRSTIGLPDEGINIDYSSLGGSWVSMTNEGFTESPYDTNTEQTLGANFGGMNLGNVLENAAKGMNDLQPDEFYYNIPGHSGMFIFDMVEFDASQMASVALYGRSYHNWNPKKIPHDDIEVWISITVGGGKIEINSFIIMDENGFKYVFDEVEKTAVISSEWPHQMESNYRKLLDQSTAFYMTAIYGPSDEIEIELEYSHTGDPIVDYYSAQGLLDDVYSVPFFSSLNVGSRRDIDNFFFQYNYDECNCLTYPDVESKLVTTVYKSIIYPTSIESKNGKVLFHYDTPRLDLANEFELDKITLLDFNGDVLDIFKLDQFYTGQNIEDYRLVLGKIERENAYGEIEPYYDFIYDDSEALPDYNSKSVDHWGYYNGISNETLLPYYADVQNWLTIPLADRSPDLLFTKVQNIVGFITPERGRIEFDFELNKYGAVNGVQNGVIQEIGGLRVSQLRMKPNENSIGEVVNIDYASVLNPSNQEGVVQVLPNYRIRSNIRFISYCFIVEYEASCNINRCSDCFSERLNGTPAYAAEVENNSMITYPYVVTSSPGKGFIEYHFSVDNIASDALDFPYLPLTYRHWRNGLLLSKTLINDDLILVSKEEHRYESVYLDEQKVLGIKVMRIPDDESYMAKEYYYQSEVYERVETKTFSYDQLTPSKVIENTITYSYNELVPGAVKEILTETNDPLNRFSLRRVKVVGDYVNEDIADENSSTIQFVKLHWRAPFKTPVEVLTLKGNSLGSLKIVSGEITTLRIENGYSVPDEVYQLELNSPLPLASLQLSDIEDGEFDFDEDYYKLVAKLLDYDLKGRLRSVEIQEAVVNSVLTDYADGRITAEVINSPSDKFAYSSFETENMGGWSYEQFAVNEFFSNVNGLEFTHSKTGLSYLNLEYSNITRSVGPGSYTLSFWAHASQPMPEVNWTQLISLEISEPMDEDGWVFYQYKLANTTSVNKTLKLEGLSWIDELRLYPQGAAMNTIAYNAD
jgi:hypothetical protein